MAQYEPIGLKSGIATTLGTDTLRADLSGLAGLVTAAPAAGDACQLSGALTIAPAVCTSANPIVGIYDGVTGSVVRRGVVVASFVGGLTLAAGDAVYLSNVAGRLTNVKPTHDNLHEVGVVVSAAASTIMLQIKPVVVLPATMMMFDARSSWLLQGDAPPAYPGEQQPFPSTAAALIAALGSPAGIVAADVQGAYLCASATPLVDSLAIGPNLASIAGGELTGRDCVGLPGSSFTSKVGCEFATTNSGFQSAGGSDYGAVPVNAQRSFLFVLRPQDAYDAGSTRTFTFWGWNNGWSIGRTAANLLQIAMFDPGLHSATVAGGLTCQWLYACVTFDDATKTGNLYTSIGDSGAVAYANPLVDAAAGRYFSLGLNFPAGGSALFQCAALYRIDKLLAKADCDTFWRAYNLNEFNTPVAYTRAGPIVVPITASRVACYGTNQPAVGFSAAFAGTDNLLKSGTVCEDGITFEPIGSDDLSSWIVADSPHVTIDGPSGMRDALKLTNNAGHPFDIAANGWSYRVANLVGATNVPFYQGAMFKAGVLDTKARTGLIFRGDAGGDESFTVISQDAVAADWTRYGATVTPVRAAHTTVWYCVGAADASDDIDFAEPYLIQNRSTAPLAWRRVSTAAAASTATPVTSITNVGNARYSPAKGRMTLRIAGFQGGVVYFLDTAGVGGGGRIAIYHLGGLRFYMNDDTGANVFDISDAVPVGATERTFVLQWNAAAGTASITEGGVVLASRAGAAWTPEPLDVTPLYVGSNAAGGQATRCNFALVNISNY
jgi:hypothetical protein